MEPAERELVEAVVTLGGDLGAGVVDAALQRLDVDGGLARAVDDAVVAVGAERLSCARTPPDPPNPTVARRAHRALADALGTDGGLQGRARRAEHLAAATLLPDANVADELAAVAAELRTAGSVAEAAARYHRSAVLSVTPNDRARRLREAGEALFLLSRFADAGVLLLEGLATTDDPIVRADIAVILGQIEMWGRGARHALAVLLPSAEAVAGIDPDLAAVLYVHASNTVIVSLDAADALRHAHRANELALAGSGAALPAAKVALLIAHTFHGDREEADALVGPLQELAWALIEADDVPEVEHLLNALGMVATITERWDVGEAFLERVVFRARAAGSASMVGVASAVLAELRFRSGRFDEALALLADDLLTTARAVGAAADAWVRGIVALRSMIASDHADVRAEAMTLVADGERLDAAVVSTWGRWILATLDLIEGDPAGAARHLDRVAAATTAGEMHEPGLAWWQVDHVEALWRAGRRHEAVTALSRLEDDAERSGRRSAVAAVARSKALLAGTIVEVETAAAASIATWVELPAPFEVARTLLVRAERRLDLGDERGAGADVAEAIALLEALPAPRWLHRAEELGVRVAATADPLAGLTEAERRVAHAVADGLSNRDVAAALFVSERTVESNLTRVYRKLGVTNRTQLSVTVRSLRPRTRSPVPPV